MVTVSSIRNYKVYTPIIPVTVSSIRNYKVYTPIIPVGSGAVTKDDFEKLFADTPTVSENHVNSEMTKLEAGLSDPKTDWSKHLLLVGVAVCRSCDVTAFFIVTTVKRCSQSQHGTNGWFPA